jgi:hypothetical protein
VLHFDGEGGWTFSALASGQQSITERLSLEDEKKQLETQLSNVGKARERLLSVCAVCA